VRIDDERDLHGQLEAAFEAIIPRPAPVDGAVRRGRAIRVRRRVAVAAGAAAAVAIGVFAVPSLLHQTASPPPVSPAKAKPYTVTVQAPGPHSAPGLIASGTIDGQSWQFTAAKPGPGGQMFTTSGPAFGVAATSQPGLALALGWLPDESADPVSFSDTSGWVLTRGPVQVQYGAVQADVTYVAVRLGNGTVLVLHPVAVYGIRAVAFAVPVGTGIVDATAYSRYGEIAAATPFNAPSGVAAFGVWLKPGQHGLARTSGRIGSGTANGHAWSVTAYLGPVGHLLPGPRNGAHLGILPAQHFLPGPGLVRPVHERGRPDGGGRARAGPGGLGHREPGRRHHDQVLAGDRGRPEALRVPAAPRLGPAELDILRQLRARGRVAGRLTLGLR
jgi:hypothetical protein